MGKPYKIRRILNAAFDWARIAHRATAEGLKSDNDVTFVCAAVIRIVTPLATLVSLAALLTAI